jgi:hypothetical protein
MYLRVKAHMKKASHTTMMRSKKKLKGKKVKIRQERMSRNKKNQIP